MLGLDGNTEHFIDKFSEAEWYAIAESVPCLSAILSSNGLARNAYSEYIRPAGPRQASIDRVYFARPMKRCRAIWQSYRHNDYFIS